MKRLKMVRGSEKHPELVKEWLKSQGVNEASDFLFETFNNNRRLYYTMGGRVFSLPDDAISLDYLNYEIVEPEEPKPKHVFQPFEKVLVRCCEGDVWQCDIYSHCDTDNTDRPYCCVGNYWLDIIPYEGNQELLGTTDSPKGGPR